jgi:hypothetical protein
VLAVTSADRLNAGWTAARRARARGQRNAKSQIERLMEGVPPHCQLITVTDGHPATLAWIGGVKGHAVTPLGVEHFGQTGTIRDLYRHFMIDADAIVSAAEQMPETRWNLMCASTGSLLPCCKQGHALFPVARARNNSVAQGYLRRNPCGNGSGSCTGCAGGAARL